MPSSIATLLDSRARSAPDRIAIRCPSGDWSNAVLREKARRTAAALRRGATNPVGVWVLVIENDPMGVAALFGGLLAGVPFIAIEAQQFTAGTLASLARQVAISGVAIVSATPFDSADLPCIDVRVACEEPAAEPTIAYDDDKALILQLTSGSSGHRRLAMHGAANLLRGAEFYRDLWSIDETDVIFVTGPIAHSFGMIGGLCTALVSGAELVLLPDFTPDEAVGLTRRAKATVLLGSPSAYELLIDAVAMAPGGGEGQQRLRLCLASGEPSRVDLRRTCESVLGCRYCQIYGSTETGVISAATDGSDTVGVPVEGAEVRLVLDNGQPAATDMAGNVEVRTQTLFEGYMNDPAATARCFRDGWIVTGDVGKRDRMGRIAILGRKDTFINVGGRKVNPIEVEAAIEDHFAVREALVYAGEDLLGFSEVRASVVFADNVSSEEIKKYLHGKLAPYEIPTTIDPCERLSRTAMGKKIRDGRGSDRRQSR